MPQPHFFEMGMLQQGELQPLGLLLAQETGVLFLCLGGKRGCAIATWVVRPH